MKDSPPDMRGKAIKNPQNSSSTGPDGISYFHLKLLGPRAIRALTNIFNHSLNNTSIPNIKKVGKIIPILKLNKPPNEPTSYRPISLLCNSSKILEKLVLSNINPNSRPCGKKCFPGPIDPP